MDWLSQISRQKYIQDLNYGYARVQAIGINFGHESEQLITSIKMHQFW